MEMNTQAVGQALILRPKGEITIDNAQELKNSAKRLLETMAQGLMVMDLSHISFIDSSGIGFLIVLKARCEDKGKRLALLKPSPQAEKILKLVQLDAFFTILADEADLAGLG